MPWRWIETIQGRYGWKKPYISAIFAASSRTVLHQRSRINRIKSGWTLTVNYWLHRCLIHLVWLKQRPLWRLRVWRYRTSIPVCESRVHQILSHDFLQLVKVRWRDDTSIDGNGRGVVYTWEFCDRDWSNEAPCIFRRFILRAQFIPTLGDNMVQSIQAWNYKRGQRGHHHRWKFWRGAILHISGCTRVQSIDLFWPRLARWCRRVGGWPSAFRPGACRIVPVRLWKPSQPISCRISIQARRIVVENFCQLENKDQTTVRTQTICDFAQQMQQILVFEKDQREKDDAERGSISRKGTWTWWVYQDVKET